MTEKTTLLGVVLPDSAATTKERLHRDLAREIARQADEWAEKYAELEPARNAIQDLNVLAKDIKELTRMLGEGIETDMVKITISKPSRRTAWDTKALVGYAAAHPELEEFRTETTSAAAVRIVAK